MAARARADSPRTELTELLRVSFEAMMLQLCFARPGVVTAYDAATGYATVRPAPNLVLPAGRGTRPMPTLARVPVLGMRGSGFGVHVPLRDGDCVMLLCSDRAMRQFDGAPYDPPGVLALSLSDAVAIPVFPSPLPDGVDPDAVTVYSEGRSAPRLAIGESEIDMRVGSSRLRIRDGRIDIEATRTEISGYNP